MVEQDRFFEQYKLYVETAETVSKKRQTANNYFLSLNSFLLVLSGYLTSLQFEIWHMLIAMAGITIGFLWIFNIKSYRQLNSAKYKVIHGMETQLPVRLFDDEWTFLERGENKRKYFKLSVVEQGVPIVFIFLYAVVLFLNIWNSLV